MEVSVNQVVAGNNPRRFMDVSELEELTRSIQSVGIIQPITVKQGENAGEYIIVAGHRRHKAAIAAGLQTIPVHVIEADNDTEAMALIENTVRSDMSAAEESDAAMALLNKNKGDMTEVALILGWTESKLRRRVALNACSEKVREALAERKIKLGIAELLATVPEHKKQDKALASIIERGMTVEQVRQLLQKLVQKLDTAIFDKAECNGCKYNTSTQKALFDETVADDAFCTNGSCYKEKTDAAIEMKSEALKTDYATVKIVRLGQAEDWTKLQAGGSDGVGEEQAKQCRSCAHFGATVSAIVGEEGTVEESICFDLSCHEKMVAAEQTPEPEPEQGSETGEDEGEEQENAGTQNAGSSKTATSTKRPAVAISNAMQTYRRGVWNKATLASLAANDNSAKALLVALIATSKSRDFDSGKVEGLCSRSIEGFKDTGGNLGKVAELLESKSERLLTICAGSAVEKMTDQDIQSVLKYLKCDLSEHWQIDKEYLGNMTKTEIQALVKTFELEEKVKDWKKINNGKKGDLIDGILSSGIDFKGMIPFNIQY